MKVELKINGKEVTLSKETLEQIKEAVKDKGEFEVGDEYYYETHKGIPQLTTNENSTYDSHLIETGKAKKTEKEVLDGIEFKKAVTRVKNYIKDNFSYDSCKWADWGNDNEIKYNFYYSYRENKFKIDYYSVTRNFSPIGYLKTEEEAEELIEKCKDDLELIIKL